MKKILVIADNKEYQKEIGNALAENGFEFLIAKDTIDGINICIKEIISLVIMDLSTQQNLGLSNIEYFRRNILYTPLLFIGNRNEVESKIIAFNAGANSYMNRPFNSLELIARVNSLIRFNVKEDHDVIINGDLKIDISAEEVFIKDVEIHFTKIEFKILYLLATNMDKTLTYDYIIDNIWGPYGQDNNGLRVFLSSIRKKLSLNSKICKYLRNETNKGYRMKKIKNS